MKKLLFVVACCLFGTLNAQHNLNPDPNGDPWWAGGVPELTPEIEAVINSYPFLELSLASQNTTLPDKVNNSDSIYMRPIFHQFSSSCSQASGVGYVFTYEINRIRNQAANDNLFTERLYPPNYTWNFLNRGELGNNSFYHDGWEIIRQNGCLSGEDYGDISYLYTGDSGAQVWKSGYEEYYSGMDNRVKSIYNIDVLADDGLDLIKHWLHNHNEGGYQTTGGLISFTIKLDISTSYGTLTEESDETGKHIILDLNASGIHAMTVVGYNDNVKFDLNDNGTITSEETGALLIANSSGDDYQDDGYVYLPYSFLDAGKPKIHTFMVIEVEEYTPEIAFKVKVNHLNRKLLSFYPGYAEFANEPSIWHVNKYPMINVNSGPLPMQGINEDPIELMIDFGHRYRDEDFYINNEFGKIALRILESEFPNDNFIGSVDELLLVDYRWNETFEIPCDADFPATIENVGGVELSFEYDLIPHESNITTNLSFHSNMVSRFMPTVDNNSTLTVEEGVRVDMYNSEIYIKSGSTLELEDNAVILAKRGNCKIVIDGSINVGSGVVFEAEDGASLEVVINNNSHDATFNNVTFKNCKLSNYGQYLTISNSLFENCPLIASYRGNVTINNNAVFDDSRVYMADQSGSPSGMLNINNCEFTRSVIAPEDYQAALEIWNYSNFSAQHNEIHKYYNGIMISQSGGGFSGNQIINNNELYDLTNSGIMTFSSTATLTSNYIHDNKFGVSFTNNSNISMHGYSYSTSYDDINSITDNSSYEVYASELSFPWYFKYNAIIDNDNGGNSNGDPLVYYDTQGGMLPPYVKHNCWGSGFSNSEDLYPTTMPYNPTWCPDDGEEKSSEVALQAYQDGLEYFENEEFEDAKSEFESIIELYPETQYASAAMKSLFDLEKFDGNDYATLQSYYETNDSIQADSLLTDLSVFLANRCEVEMENWQTAIDHYEDVIENTDDPQDSIFAIIDLGYAYLLMGDDESRATVLGKMTEHIPNSIPSFIEKRDYLLSLLPIEKTKEHMPETSGINENSDILKQNTPNPFSNSTTIYYDLPNQSNVVFKVYDSKGSIVKTIDLSVQEKGLNNFELDMQQMPKGLYFYSIFTDGNLVGSKKMIVK